MLIKTCLNDTYVKVPIDKNLPDAFPVEIEKEMLYPYFFSTFLKNIPSGRSKRSSSY